MMLHKPVGHSPIQFWQTFRWCILLPSVLAAWWTVVLIGFLTTTMLELMCDQIVCGQTETQLFTFVSCSFAALAAATMVLTAAWVAPSHQRFTAGIAYIIGALSGFWLCLGTEQMILPFGYAILILIAMRTTRVLRSMAILTTILSGLGLLWSQTDLTLLCSAIMGGMAGLIWLSQNQN